MADDFDVVVAGGGIAGLTAALYTARLGRSTLVLTGGVPGGLLLSIDAIEGLPGFPDGVPGYELCPAAQEQAAAAGAEFEMAEFVSIEPGEERWKVGTTAGDRLARVVILATGGRLRPLGVEGEDRLRGRGVSHCASCDAPLLRDRIVGVVGGGDSALQEALTLAESVAQVTIFHRGDALSAQDSYQRRTLEHPRISIRYATLVEEVLGSDSVSGARVHDIATGRRGDVELAALFVYVGLQPNGESVAERVHLSATGHVPTDVWMRTELPGVFAAGIVRSDTSGQAAGAIGDGATAAIAADRYLEGAGWPERALTPATAGVFGDGGVDG